MQPTFTTVVLVLCALCLCAPTLATEYSVYYTSGTYKVETGKLDESAACMGVFEEELLTRGWSSLWIQSNPKYPDAVAMHAAGVLEGFATAHLIADMNTNMMGYYFGNATAMPDKVAGYLNEQAGWVVETAKAKGAGEPYWAYAGLLMEQVAGLAEGAAAVDASLNMDVMLFLQASGDLLNLVNALKDPAEQPDFDGMSNEEVMAYFEAHSLCSGLFKVTPTLDNIYAAHAAWFTYAATNRIAKSYHFDLNMGGLAAKKMVFSSYPAFLESLDDFYIMDSGLMMVQTTNAVFNMSLFDGLNATSMLSWQAVRIANALATTGPQWMELDAYLNAGTYSNMYMIFNYGLFEPGLPLKPNTLFVMDQIPNLTVGSDLTALLNEGYFPSYNVPFHPTVWELSGYGAMEKKTGSTSFSYDLAPRAKIFRRNQTDVVSMDSFKALMRFNAYGTGDPLAPTPMAAICSRGDLVKDNPSPGGCYDGKVTDYKGMLDLAFDFISGPTQSDGLPPFTWSGPFDSTTHVGLPHTYTFDWAPFSSKLPH